MQYKPWFIKISNMKKRLILALAVSLFGLVLVLIVVGATQGFECQNMMSKGADYRGNTDRTRSGLECVAWDTLDRNTHTVTIDRWVSQDSFFLNSTPTLCSSLCLPGPFPCNHKDLSIIISSIL